MVLAGRAVKGAVLGAVQGGGHLCLDLDLLLGLRLASVHGLTDERLQPAVLFIHVLVIELLALQVLDRRRGGVRPQVVDGQLPIGRQHDDHPVNLAHGRHLHRQWHGRCLGGPDQADIVVDLDAVVVGPDHDVLNLGVPGVQVRGQATGKVVQPLLLAYLALLFDDEHSPLPKHDDVWLVVGAAPAELGHPNVHNILPHVEAPINLDLLPPCASRLAVTCRGLLLLLLRPGGRVQHLVLVALDVEGAGVGDEAVRLGVVA
mmetsp:Transcript_43109/g.77460  ORF Transcript_43109/g.77460 Transcript_43109/m.77460 type:complete len:260 (-) Transcript_43109:629-1408(-)